MNKLIYALTIGVLSMNLISCNKTNPIIQDKTTVKPIKTRATNILAYGLESVNNGTSFNLIELIETPNYPTGAGNWNYSNQFQLTYNSMPLTGVTGLANIDNTTFYICRNDLTPSGTGNHIEILSLKPSISGGVCTLVQSFPGPTNRILTDIEYDPVTEMFCAIDVQTKEFVILDKDPSFGNTLQIVYTLDYESVLPYLNGVQGTPTGLRLYTSEAISVPNSTASSYNTTFIFSYLDANKNVVEHKLNFEKTYQPSFYSYSGNILTQNYVSPGSGSSSINLPNSTDVTVADIYTSVNYGQLYVSEIGEAVEDYFVPPYFNTSTSASSTTLNFLDLVKVY